MDSMTRLRIMRLLEDANRFMKNVAYEDIPTKYKNRAETIQRKIVDLKEDFRDIQTM